MNVDENFDEVEIDFEALFDETDVDLDSPPDPLYAAPGETGQTVLFNVGDPPEDVVVGDLYAVESSTSLVEAESANTIGTDLRSLRTRGVVGWVSEGGLTDAGREQLREISVVARVPSL